MYTVVDFNLPDGLNVTLKDYKKFEFFNAHFGEGTTVVPNKLLSIEVPDSGGQEITLMRYLVGERIVFRKSLTGLKIIRGLPDYTGAVTRVDLIRKIPAMVTQLRDRHQERQESLAKYKAGVGKYSGLYQHNLCREIPLHSSIGWDPSIDWTNLTTARTDDRMETIGELAANLDGFTRTVTGRSTGISEDAQAAMMRALLIESQSYGIRNTYYQRSGRSLPVSEMSRRYTNSFELSGMDFDGDALMATTQSEENRRFREEMSRVQAEATPTRFAINSFDYANDRIEVVPVDLATAVTATRELTRGERAGPPQSRGPRPRSQRW